MGVTKAYLEMEDGIGTQSDPEVVNSSLLLQTEPEGQIDLWYR